MQGIFSIARCAQRCNQCPSAHLDSESTTGMVTVLLVDDQPTVRQGLRMRLALEDDLVVVGEAGDGMSALQQAVVLRPNVVVMDLTMPRLDGIAATLALGELGIKTAVVVLSIHEDMASRARALAAGAAFFVEKDASVDVLLEAIRRAGRGDKSDSGRDPTSG